jgi:hypothetical protein
VENYLRKRMYYSLLANTLFTVFHSVQYRKCKRNSYIQNIITKHKYDLITMNANVTSYQVGIYNMGIKLFSKIPSTTKSVNVI